MVADVDAAGVTTVGVVGLGIMGSAMSGHLVAAGFDVVGIDPVESAAAALRDRGGRSVADVAALARQAAVVVT